MAPAGTLAAESPSQALAWGDNSYGDLGDGGAFGAASRVPVAVSGLSEAASVSAGTSLSLALLKNGTVMAWGADPVGQLGNGTTKQENNVPVSVCASGQKAPCANLLGEVGAIAAGESFSLALLSDGKVMAWGSNQGGELGVGSTSGPESCAEGVIACSRSPVQVSGLSEVTAIAAGREYALALLRSGKVMAWGNDPWGLGNGAAGVSDVPVEVQGLSNVSAIATGGNTGLALLSDGSVMAWGYNGEGELGDGTTTGPERCTESNTACSRTPVAVSGLSGVISLAGGWTHELALLSNGTAVAWGNNGSGQLGTGSTSSSDVPVPVSGLSGATALAAGYAHSLAVLSDGTAMAWGWNSGWQLGSAMRMEHSDVPVTVDGLREVKSISAGHGHSLAVGVEGVLPTVSSVSPAGGPSEGGTSVTISGAHFHEVSAVRFGTANATSFTVNSESSITAVSPPGAGIVDVSVITPEGTSPADSGDEFAYARPTVTKVQPASGPRSGGTVVTITGTNFTGVTAVSFGSVRATKFTVNSESSITATVPPVERGEPEGGFTVDVTVVANGERSATSEADHFTYFLDACERDAENSYPVITNIEPHQGPAGTAVTITGERFFVVAYCSEGFKVKKVMFGSHEATSFKEVSANTVEAIAPAGSGTVDITVETLATSPTSPRDQFTYPPVPATVTKVEPDAGPPAGGTSVSITGTNLTGATAVRFGSTNATSFKVNSSSSISAVSPAGTGTADVTVTTPEGTSATSEADQFTYEGPPTVTRVEPAEGPEAGGSTVKITGTNLTGASAVKFGSSSASGVTVTSPTSLTAVAPAGKGAVDVRVTTPSGTSATSSSDRFSYAPAPNVSKVEPGKGPEAGGTTVTISGANLGGASAVHFGASEASGVKVNSPSSITATSPAGAGTVDVTVTTAGGTSATSAADRFTYAAPPSVTAVEPNEGPAAGGTSVTITGTNLLGATSVKFGSSNAKSFTVVSSSSIMAVSPSGSGTVQVTVSTAGGTSPTSSADQFNYLSTPTVTKVEPGQGPEAGGTTVSITGTNFTAGSTVRFGSAAATVTVNSPGSITAVSPPGRGTADVRVTTPGGTSATSASDHFSYVPAPSISKVEPGKGPESGGTTVTISGANLSGASAVRFGSNSATSVKVNSAGSITAVSPSGAGTVDVSVTTPGGTSATSSADHFTYVAPPTVTGVEPHAGRHSGGTSVAITGMNLTGATAVKFGSTNAKSFSVVSETSITAVSPTGTGTVDVTVTTPGGTTATVEADRFDYGPTVSSVRPRNGPAAGGTSVTLTGTNFNEVTAVQFGSTNAKSFTVASESSISAVSPPFTGESASVPVIVTTHGGVSPTTEASSILPEFYFRYGPTVTRVEPSSGPSAGGNSVVIEGTGFESVRGGDEFLEFVTAVRFGSNSASSFEVSRGSIRATAPPGSGTVDVTVETYGGTSPITPADRYGYL